MVGFVMSSIMQRLAGCVDVRELGGGVTQMAKRLHMRQSGVAYAVRKGERIFRDKNLQMTV